MCVCGLGELSWYSDSIRDGQSGNWIPVWGEIFRTCPDRPWGQPSFLYNGYRVSFPGVKRPGRGVDHPPPSSAEVKERVELYFDSPLWTFVTCYRVNLTFIIILGLNVFGCSVGKCMNRSVMSSNSVA